MTSQAEALVQGLEAIGPDALEVALDECSILDLAALNFDWSFWAREKQTLPEGDWLSAGFQTGRAWGKSSAVVNYAIQEIGAGRARRTALVGPSEDQTIGIFIFGASGFLESAPPGMCHWEPSTKRLLFSNGSFAQIFSAGTPDQIRGPSNQLGLATEVSSWPTTTRAAALQNLKLTLRPRGRLLWDSTPRIGNPIIRKLRKAHFDNPSDHLLIEGESRENTLISKKTLDEWHQELDGTTQGDEELYGRFIDEDQNAIFAAVKRCMGGRPNTFSRRIISIDPSSAGEKHNDGQGIIEAGLGEDKNAYVLGNYSGKYHVSKWPEMVLDKYGANRCDLVYLEANHKVTVWAQIFSDACGKRGWTFREVPEDKHFEHEPGILNFRSYFTGHRDKPERARGAAFWVEKNRVIFVEGGLGNLVEHLLNFDGVDGKADDDVDATVAAISELLSRTAPVDAMVGVRGLQLLADVWNGWSPTSRPINSTAGLSWTERAARLRNPDGI